MLAVAAGASAALLLTACGGDGSAAAHEGMTSRSTPVAAASADFNDADVMFAQMMIPHHEQAVEMAQLAQTRASDQEVRDLAVRIKAAQDPEIKLLQDWLAEWGRLAAPGEGMDHGMAGMMTGDDMKTLEAATGTAFDRNFAQMMIAHHNGAIQMAKTEQAGGVNPDAVALAKTIETTQQAEVDQLQAILDRL
ncbi:DUF305 domain-containing protein [Acrocarpospora catenulata]|uniref:DUF305 domain-containing protein n=1 Tax=Acrocarpospora catenulata TaxID=2836182 RepID=UPI002023A1C4|nr:DUF305 domain-containing protein [Acrocarpospora catenulata]